jgi:hypothetical protein
MKPLWTQYRVDKNMPAFELCFMGSTPSGITSERLGEDRFYHTINASSWEEAVTWASKWDHTCLSIRRLW